MTFEHLGYFFDVRQFGDNHKVKLGKNHSKTNGVKLSKMASGLWVSLRYFIVSKSRAARGSVCNVLLSRLVPAHYWSPRNG